MKKTVFICIMLLLSTAALAQTTVQPSTVPVDTPGGSNLTDVIAIVISGLSVSALIFYLVYLYTLRKDSLKGTEE